MAWNKSDTYSLKYLHHKFIIDQWLYKSLQTGGKMPLELSNSQIQLEEIYLIFFLSLIRASQHVHLWFLFLCRFLQMLCKKRAHEICTPSNWFNVSLILCTTHLLIKLMDYLGLLKNKPGEGNSTGQWILCANLPISVVVAVTIIFSKQRDLCPSVRKLGSFSLTKTETLKDQTKYLNAFGKHFQLWEMWWRNHMAWLSWSKRGKS